MNNDTVVKFSTPLIGEVEANISWLARNLGLVSGLFYVPKLIRWDKNTSRIEFEKIEGFSTIGQLFLTDDFQDDILYRTGMALACLHENLELPTSLNWRYKSEKQTPGQDMVALHGDFNTMNVGYKHDSDQIVIFDWSSAPVFEQLFSFGPRYIDLASFLRSLLVHQASFTRARKFFNARAEQFIKGYQAGSSNQLDTELLKDYLIDISSLHLANPYKTKSNFKNAFREIQGTFAHMFLKKNLQS